MQSTITNKVNALIMNPEMELRSLTLNFVGSIAVPSSFVLADGDVSGNSISAVLLILKVLAKRGATV